PAGSMNTSPRVLRLSRNRGMDQSVIPSLDKEGCARSARGGSMHAPAPPPRRLRRHLSSILEEGKGPESNLVVPLRAFLRALDGFLRRLIARGGFGDHVHDDEVGERARGRVAELAGIPRGTQLLAGVAVSRVFRVHRPNRVFLVGNERARGI